MMDAGLAAYHVFATWTSKGSPVAIGTADELRGGVWYSGCLESVPTLQLASVDRSGVQRSGGLTLTTTDAGVRGDAAGGGLSGTVVTVDFVRRVTSGAGVVTDSVRTVKLTITGQSLKAGRAELTLSDLEDGKLATLYPLQRWTAEDWPDVPADQAGKPACYPVGTALALPSALLRSDAAGTQWTYGACAGNPRLIAITAINAGLKQFTVAADPRAWIRVGQVIIITGSTATDGRYTVATTTATTITVVEPVTAASGGSVRVMPHPLTVYRAGRVVPPAEYGVQHLVNPGPLINGDFAAGLAGWTTYYFTTGGGFVTTNPGAGSSLSVSAGLVTISSVSASNFAFLRQAFAAGGVKGSLYALQITVLPGTDVWVNNSSAALAAVFPAGKTTTILIPETLTGAWIFDIYAPSHSGTVQFRDVRIIPIGATLMRFASEQRDFQGQRYAITADMAGVDSRNPADEAARLLTAAGLTIDAATFVAAAADAMTAAMMVDCDYGRDGQRKISAILEDFAFLLRGGFQRTAAGAYGVWQDRSGASTLTLSADAGDSVDVDDASWPAQPTMMGINYRPGPAASGELQSTLTRAVAGGLMGEQPPRALRYLRSHDSAARLLCYLVKRAALGGQMAATVWRRSLAQGDVITLASALHWAGNRDWLVTAVDLQPNASRIMAVEYDATVYVYTPVNASGRDPVDDYTPDYSLTPPLAPTALTILSGGIGFDVAGGGTAYITARCVAPAANWAQIWLGCVHNVTGELTMVQASLSAGTYSATLTGLRGGEVYRLRAWAVNANNVQGVLQDTFNAVALGGGVADTTFTAPGYVVAPPAPSSCSRRQGTGKSVVVTWPAIALPADLLAEYQVQRLQAPGSTYFDIWTGRALSMTDGDINYNTSYTYRVRAKDRWGNVSSTWATSSAIGVAANVSGGSGGDITAGSVSVFNRAAVTTISSTFTIGGSGNFFSYFGRRTMSHSLGVVPIATLAGSLSDGYGCISAIMDLSSSSVSVCAMRPPPETQVTATPAVGVDHAHDIKLAATITVTVSVAIW